MRTVRFVLPYARAYWRRYLLGLFLVPVSVAAALAVPWLTGECVDVLREERIDAMETLPRYLGWIVAFALVSALSLLGTRWWIISASRRVEYDLRDRIFGHIQTLDQSYYSRARTGDIMSRVTIDVERARLLAGPIILYSTRTLVMLALAVPVMAVINIWLTLLIMVPLALLSFAVRKIGPRVHRENLLAQETLGELSSLAQEDFSGIRVAKAFAREEHESALFREVAERYMRQNLRVARISAWMHPIVGAVGDLALISLLVVGGLLILGGGIQLGDFVKFAGYQGLLLWPMISIGWVVNQYHRAGSSIVRLEEMLSVKPRVQEHPEPQMPPSGRIEGAVSIRGLTFSYGAEPVLRGVSLEAPAGSTIAIVGRTGCGKSTLVHLIPRVLPVPDGTVFVDGVDVNRIPLGDLRRSIGFVPQESFLFSQSVHENISFGVDELVLEDVLDAAEISRFAKDIGQLPGGYDELVGERGVTLSGGQKQRAALARALLIRPRILILDDAFSAVDTETEAEILRNLGRVTRHLTTIIVSHRVSTIRHADRIYVLDEGIVVEDGTHEDLMRLGGQYAEMYRLQRISDELDKL